MKIKFNPPHLTGMEMITAERLAQSLQYDAMHDDTHDRGELLTEAECLLHQMQDDWGLLAKTNGDRIRQLVIAAALIAAEIDRKIREKSRNP